MQEELTVKNMLHAGTFDVENYGDLLFPLLLSSHLADRNFRYLSPAGGQKIWDDCVPSLGLESVLDQEISGLVIGGGNIIHPSRSALREYRAAEVDFCGYADLWIGAPLAANSSLPVLWNSPGVPGPIEPEFFELVKKALKRADYLSVRDEESKACLLEIKPDTEVAILPDTAWDLPSLWSREILDIAFDAFERRQFGGKSGDFFCVHLNDRYLRDISLTETAELLDHLSEELDARPVLIAIGRCHGDHLTAALVSSAMKTNSIVIDKPTSLIEVAAVISRSKIYVGSSMHGYITGAAFARPSVLVASGKLKFDGVVRQASAPETLLTSWRDVPDLISNIDVDQLSSRFSAAQKNASNKLKTHWARMTDMISERDDHGSACLDRQRFFAYRQEFFEASTRYHHRKFKELNEINARTRITIKDLERKGRSLSKRVSENQPKTKSYRKKWSQKLSRSILGDRRK